MIDFYCFLRLYVYVLIKKDEIERAYLTTHSALCFSSVMAATYIEDGEECMWTCLTMQFSAQSQQEKCQNHIAALLNRNKGPNLLFMLEIVLFISLL